MLLTKCYSYVKMSGTPIYNVPVNLVTAIPCNPGCPRSPEV